MGQKGLKRQKRGRRHSRLGIALLKNAAEQNVELAYPVPASCCVLEPQHSTILGCKVPLCVLRIAVANTPRRRGVWGQYEAPNDNTLEDMMSYQWWVREQKRKNPHRKPGHKEPAGEQDVSGR